MWRARQKRTLKLFDLFMQRMLLAFLAELFHLQLLFQFFLVSSCEIVDTLANIASHFH